MPERKTLETRVWFNKSFSSLEHSLSKLRSAWRGERPLRILASHTREGCAAFFHADEVFTEPGGDMASEVYTEWCLKQCRERGVSVFVPGRRMAELAAHVEDFATAGTRLLVAAGPETMRLLHDKAQCHAALEGMLPLPETHLVTNISEFHEAVRVLKEAGHRVCFKPASGAGGVGFHVLDERATLRKRMLKGMLNIVTFTEAEQAFREGGSFPRLVVMEHLPGVEFSVDALAWRGELRLALARCKDGSVQIIDRHPELEAHMRKLTAHFGLNGLFNAQFRTDRDGVLKFLEINPRMSGGLGHTEATGVSLLALALELCLSDGTKPAAMPVPQVPVTVFPCHRSFPIPTSTLGAEESVSSKEEAFS